MAAGVYPRPMFVKAHGVGRLPAARNQPSKCSHCPTSVTRAGTAATVHAIAMPVSSSYQRATAAACSAVSPSSGFGLQAEARVQVLTRDQVLDLCRLGEQVLWVLAMLDYDLGLGD